MMNICFDRIRRIFFTSFYVQMINDSKYKHLSHEITPLTPPVSPLFNMQNGPTVPTAWYYADTQPRTLDFQRFQMNNIPNIVQPSPERIDYLVSEHFRNCGVNPSLSGPVDVNGNLVPMHFTYDHVIQTYPRKQQVILLQQVCCMVIFKSDKLFVFF